MLEVQNQWYFEVVNIVLILFLVLLKRNRAFVCLSVVYWLR